MDRLFNEQTDLLNWITNLLSCFTSALFFSAFITTKQKPIPLKMISLLITSGVLGSFLRIISPYMITNTLRCATLLELTTFFFTFSGIWASFMAILTFRSLKFGFEALTNKFFRLSLVVSVLGSIILTTIPLWLENYLNIVFLPEEGICTLTLVKQQNQLIGDIALFLFSTFPGVYLFFITVISVALIKVKKYDRNTVILPNSFQINMRRLMWYPIAQILIYIAILFTGIWGNFSAKNDDAVEMTQIILGLGGFVSSSVYILQRFLIEREGRKLGSNDVLSISLSEKFCESATLVIKEKFCESATFAMKNESEY